ncbi:MAG: metallophosphoesterase [Candidatus Altiarchaeota archaeon]
MKKAHIFAFLALLLIAYALVEPYLLRVYDVVVSDSKVPESFRGKRIAFLSDIHCGRFLSTDRVGGIVDLTNGLNPDMVLLGGDFIYGGVDDIDPCISVLGGLKAPMGVFAVLGNHDNWAGAGQTNKALEAAGIRVLDNEAVWVGSGGSRLKVGGVGDMWTESQDLNPTLENTSKDDFVLLLSHNPQYADRIGADRVSLMLSGHTHGGQIFPFRLITPYLASRFSQRYPSGVYELNNTKLIVTNGIGTVFIPLRFMTRPEIVLITLES